MTQSIDTGLNLGQLHVNPRCSLVRKTHNLIPHSSSVFFFFLFFILHFVFCIAVFFFLSEVVCWRLCDFYDFSLRIKANSFFIYSFYSLHLSYIFLSFLLWSKSFCDETLKVDFFLINPICFILCVLVLQDIEHGASPDGPNVSTVPKKCEKALLARIWGNFDKK